MQKPNFVRSLSSSSSSSFSIPKPFSFACLYCGEVNPMFLMKFEWNRTNQISQISQTEICDASESQISISCLEDILDPETVMYARKLQHDQK